MRRHIDTSMLAASWICANSVVCTIVNGRHMNRLNSNRVNCRTLTLAISLTRLQMTNPLTNTWLKIDGENRVSMSFVYLKTNEIQLFKVPHSHPSHPTVQNEVALQNLLMCLNALANVFHMFTFSLHRFVSIRCQGASARGSNTPQSHAQNFNLRSDHVQIGGRICFHGSIQVAGEKRTQRLMSVRKIICYAAIEPTRWIPAWKW